MPYFHRDNKFPSKFPYDNDRMFVRLNDKRLLRSKKTMPYRTTDDINIRECDVNEQNQFP